MTARPLPEAARALGVSTSTLRRWMQAGAPVARRGRRGRGCRALLDPVAVQAWREGERGDADAALRDLAGRLPELIGDAMAEAFRNGNLGIMDYARYRNMQSDTEMRQAITQPENRGGTA